MNRVGDFHVHTNFCPHGSDDAMESYVLAAIDKGLAFITFTEHAPLPKNFTDPTPLKDSAMRWEDVDRYLEEASRLKEKYKSKIAINIGFEVDYIEGYEEDTKEILDQFGKYLDDSILSVHMLKAPNGDYVCIDYSLEQFKRIIELFGTIDNVYSCYYQTVQKALYAKLGKYKPVRIGHLTLIEKFSKVYKPKANFENEIDNLLEIIKGLSFELDANASGFFKEYCGSGYPNSDIIAIASKIGIPLVLGSDSHTNQHIGRGFDLFPKNIEFSLPKSM